MNGYKKWIALLAAMLAMALCMTAWAEEISTTVTMRVSRSTRSAIVNVGEDLSLEVAIEGPVPAGYQWFFEGTAIPGANERVYNIVNAQTDDSGVYRLEAYGDDGQMLVSMDISARVIDDVLPKAGDDSLPLGAAAAAFAMAAGAMALALRRRIQA